MFEPVRTLLQRYTVAICATFGSLTPDAVTALPWWQFEEMCDYVDREEERKALLSRACMRLG